MGQSLIIIKAQFKLRNRHISEWGALAANQNMVLRLVRQENDQKLSACGDNKLVRADLRYWQSARLINLIASQRDERQQMKVRHWQEETYLEEASQALD